MRKWNLWLSGLLLCLLLAVPATVFALEIEAPPGAEGPGAEAAPEPTPAPETGPVTAAPKEEEAAPGEEPSLLSIVINNSGIPGWIIILMSFVSITLMVKFSVQFTKEKMMPMALIEALDNYFKEKKIKEAVDLCKTSDTVLARIVGSALGEIRNGYSEMEKVMEEVTEEESVKMNQDLSWLSLIGAIAPMLGLLGTVLGMVGAFAQIAAAGGQPKPADLAENIQLALITTCEGLIVAVPTLVGYAIFRNRVIKLLLEIGVAATSLIGRFKNMKITPAMVAGAEQGKKEGGGGAAGGGKPPITGAGKPGGPTGPPGTPPPSGSPKTPPPGPGGGGPAPPPPPA